MHTLSTTERAAIWLAWHRKCAYTGDLLSFSDVQIDHILPAYLINRPQELQALKAQLGLADNFEVNSLANYLPCSGIRNRQKADLRFDESAARYFLELARDRLHQVQVEIRRLRDAAKKEVYLTQLAAMVENGSTCVEEITEFIESVVARPREQDYEPLVVTVGVGPVVFDGAVFFAATCDDLEIGLSEALRQRFGGVIVQTEPSERTSESLSIRFAIWHAKLEDVESLIVEPWELLEVAAFSEIYPGESAMSVYRQALQLSFIEPR